jgi:FtsZ-binding cell division protein ZapB
VRSQFSIDAPRMSVRSHLPWPWRVVLGLALVAMVGGMWWWGFDFGQIFGGFNRKEVESRIAALDTEVATLRADAAGLRTRNSQLESEGAMARGAQATLTKQAEELQNENAQLKEELVFLQQLVADTSRQAGLSFQRIDVERERANAYRYRLLVVRGGKPKDDFDGNVTLQVTIQPDAGSPKPVVLSLPEEQPRTAAALKLKFKYYQRLEGTFEVPAGALVRSVVARAYEAGQTAPRATRNLTM